MARTVALAAVVLAAFLAISAVAVNTVEVDLVMTPATLTAEDVNASLIPSISSLLNTSEAHFNISRMITTMDNETATILSFTYVLVIHPVTVTAANTSLNGTAHNVTASNVTERTPLQLAREFEHLRNNATDAYLTIMGEYNITAVTVIELTTPAPPTTTVRVTPPPTPRTNNTNTTLAPTTTSTAPRLPTPAPSPTAVDPDKSNETYAPQNDEESNTGLIMAVIFGVIGVILLVACVTICIKKFATREKSDTTKRGGGFKYARNSHA